jgi:D-alanine transaminase
LLGDGVYEALPVYGRRLFRFDDHMARLARNLDRLRIPAPHDAAGWECGAWWRPSPSTTS